MISAFYGLLEGIGFRQPLHPIPVRFTVAMVVGALVFALIARASNRTALYTTARHVLTFGVVAYVLTAVTGLMDWLYFYGGAWGDLIQIKVILGVVLLPLLIAAVHLNVKNKGDSTLQLFVYLGASVVVLVIMYYGAELAR